MKIAIISHTEHYRDSSGKIRGWGPTIKEINKLAVVSNSIVHIAPFHNGNAPDSSLSYSAKNINYLPLRPSGGKGYFWPLYQSPSPRDPNRTRLPASCWKKKKKQ